jgi:hypothetical protein
MNPIVGMNGHGLRYARSACGHYRITAYAEGGYCPMQQHNGKWYLFPKQERMPAEIELALCSALNIPVQD